MILECPASCHSSGGGIVGRLLIPASLAMPSRGLSRPVDEPNKSRNPDQLVNHRRTKPADQVHDLATASGVQSVLSPPLTSLLFI